MFKVLRKSDHPSRNIFLLSVLCLWGQSSPLALTPVPAWGRGTGAIPSLWWRCKTIFNATAMQGGRGSGRCCGWSPQKVRTEQVKEVFLSPMAHGASTAPSGSGPEPDPQSQPAPTPSSQRKRKNRDTRVQYNHNLKNKATGILW